MAMNNPYTQYKQNSITTATPEELTLKLYNGVIKFMKIAKMNMEEKKVQDCNSNLMRSQDIIDELNMTLNMDYEISTQLRNLYNFVKEQLIEANIQKDTKILDGIIPIMEDMRDTWKEAMEIAKKGIGQTEAVGAN